MNRLYRGKTILLTGAVLAALAAAAPPARADSPDPMLHARELLAQFEWEPAYKAFADIAAAEKPATERWDQATFGAAVASSNIQPLDKSNADRAAELYQKLLAADPQSKYAPRTMMNLGRLKELRDYPGDQPDLDGAKDIYLKVAATWPNDPIAGEATLRAAAAQVQAYDFPKFEKVKAGVSLLQNWVDSHPADPMISLMWQYLGDSYFLPLEQYQKSLDSYEKVDSLGWTDAGNQGPTYWRAAILAERVGNSKLAIKYYTKSVVETPTSGKAYEAQLALKRLGAPVPAIEIYTKAAPTTAPTTPTSPEGGQ